MVTIKEIARLSGVSRGTVDRVLNNRGSVKPETAEKVMQVIKDVNYSPSRAGKTLAIKKKQLKFGFILFSSTSSNPFFLDVVRGIQARADFMKEYGVTVETRYATLDNPQLQVQLIDELINKGINGLAITPINHPIVAEKLKEIAKNGIPVVTSNSDIPNCGRIAYVGSDYYKSGETAAGLMNLICGQDTKVGIITGSHWILCHSERIAGFTDNINKNYPNIQIIDTAINNDDDAESFIVTRKMLTEHPEINALYLVAAGIQGACRAVDDLGLRGKIKIISYDTTEPTCKLVRENVIIATIAQQAFTQGAKPLDILLDYVGLNIKPEKEYFYTKIEIKIKENL